MRGSSAQATQAQERWRIHAAFGRGQTRGSKETPVTVHPNRGSATGLNGCSRPPLSADNDAVLRYARTACQTPVLAAMWLGRGDVHNARGVRTERGSAMYTVRCS